MLNYYQDLLSLILESVALIAKKIESLEIIALSKLSHRFPNMHMTEPKLNGLDQFLISAITKILNLTYSTTTKTCFQPQSEMG